MDSMHITGIRSYGYIGALPEEQCLGQWFEVDLILWLDLSVSGQSDFLPDTIDYCDVIEIVQTLIKTSKFLLLERLATVIAEKVLTLDRVSEVQVHLAKSAAPIPDFDGKVAVEIKKRREALHAL
jgi:7,8-dihydroneopterin aldolase/epimerase/oxygenase